MRSRTKVTFVGMSKPLSCAREWLARTRGCPNRSLSWPSGKVKSMAPAGDASEPMRLIESSHVGGFDFGD